MTQLEGGTIENATSIFFRLNSTGIALSQVEPLKRRARYAAEGSSLQIRTGVGDSKTWQVGDL
jgi:hypothetical protein